MSAIITSNFRFENAANFIADVADSSNGIYLSIGKSDTWSSTLTGVDGTPDVPTDDQIDPWSAWANMIALTQITASNMMNLIPRLAGDGITTYNWQSGTAYSQWDDSDASIFTKIFYILTTEFKVYKCVVAGPGASTVMPTQTNTNPTPESDGYTWKYMFELSSIDSTNFLTSSFIPVKTVVIPIGETIGDLNSDDQTKYTLQQNSAANVGKIYAAVVTAGGTGYTTAPSVTIHGDGAGATATATIAGGSVTKVTITANGTSPYNNATISFSGGGGTNAAARPILSPPGGHGTDPVRELGGFYAGLQTSLQNGSGDFIVNNSFRQIGIVKNPTTYGTTTICSAATYSALKEILFSTNSGFTNGDYITGGTSGAVAYIDSYDPVGGTLKYHQNNKTGYTAFQLGETVTGYTSGTGVVNVSTGLINPTVQPYSGQTLFLENRSPINRSASQIENVKVVLEF